MNKPTDYLPIAATEALRFLLLGGELVMNEQDQRAHLGQDGHLIPYDLAQVFIKYGFVKEIPRGRYIGVRRYRSRLRLSVIIEKT